MSEGWEIRELGDACILTMGQSPESSTYNETGNGMPFFQGCADFGAIHPVITTYCSAPKKIAEVDDVLMSVRAPIGTLNVANVQCCIGRGLASIRQKPGITIYKYLYYFISKSKKRLQDLGTGATFKAIGKGTLVSFPIPVPPIAEQEKIVAELDCLSGIVEKKKQQLEELDKLAQSIFYDMFGDPVSNENGYPVVKMSDICTKIADGVHSKPNYTAEGVPFISVVNINTGKLSFEGCKYVSRQGYEFMTRKTKPEKGDVLYTKVGATYGIPALVDTDDEFCLYVSVCLLKLKREQVLPAFLVQEMALPFIKYQADDRISGIGVPDLHLNQIGKFNVLLPPLILQNEFAHKIEAIEKQKELVKRSIVETEMLFRSRMDYWFN